MHGANCTTKTIFYELLAIINSHWSMERHNRNVCGVKIIMLAKHMAVMITLCDPYSMYPSSKLKLQ